MFAMLDEYYIRDYIGYFIMDNATANNYMFSSISDNFFKTNKVNYNTQQHWLRYNDHIINLSMQDNEKDLILAKLQSWHKIGPLEKLHNIAV